MNPEKIPQPNNPNNPKMEVPSQQNNLSPNDESGKIFNIDYKPAEKDETRWEREDKIHEYYEKFLDNINDENYYKKQWDYWHNNFADGPYKFYAEENFKELHKLEPAERFAHFFYSTKSLYITPQDVQKYFNEFPNDLIMAANLYNERGGRPDTCLELEFFGTVASSIKNRVLNNDYHLRDNLERSQRKSLAPKLLLGNYQSEKIFDEVFGKFKEATDGFEKTFGEASKLNWGGNYRLNPNKMFTPEYKELSGADKAEFLRLCLNETHNALVFDEVWNSCFTAEMAERQKQRSHTSLLLHNVAHSMVYKTYQPLSSFHADQIIYTHEMNNTSAGGGYNEEYPFHRLLLLAIIDKLGKTTTNQDLNTDLLVEFWNKNRNPIFANTVADALSKQNPTRAAGKLLECIRQEPEDKRALAAILYRLELGQLNISKDGALYLEKMYDLGLYNNPDYHVSRLTPNGEIGIFNEEKELIKYFELGDLTSEEKKIKAQVLDISYDTLFFAKENETKEEYEKRLGYLAEFKKHYYDLAQDQIFKETDVQLNNLTFKEQGWFLTNLKNSTIEEKTKLINFIKQYGEEGIKTFLSLNQDEKMGDKILLIGEKLEDEGADLIFEKYNSITHYLNSLDQEISKYFSDKKHNPTQIKNIANDLLKKAQRVLTNYADKIESGQPTNYKNISQDIKNISEEIVLFSTVFKEAQKNNPNIELSDVANANIAKRTPSELSIEDIVEMERIYTVNKQHWPKKLLDEALNEFKNDIKDNKGRFYILKVHDKITSFSWFNDISDARTYCGYFNVRPEARESNIGQALKHVAYQTEGQFKTLECYVYEQDKALVDNYGKNYGFKIEKENCDPTGTGKMFYKLSRPVQAKLAA